MRLKGIAIVLILLGLSTEVYQQEPGNVRFSLKGECLTRDFFDQYSYGFSLELFVSSRLSLDYNYTMGIDDQNRYCFFFPGSASAVISFFGEEMLYEPYFIEDNWEWLMFTFLIPDGLSFHAYPREWLEVAPYIYPLSGEFNSFGCGYISVGLASGLKAILKPIPSVSIGPYFGFRKKYSNNHTALNYGLSVGLMF